MKRLLASLLLSSALIACQTAPTPGGACARSSECTSPLACHFGRCRVACAADRDCASGASCLLDTDSVGTCTLESDLGCETGIGRDCAAGLVCVADRCAQTCSATMGCATGSICTPTGTTGVSFCAPSGLDAGIPADLDAAASSGVALACIGDGFVCATTATTGQPYCWGQAAGWGLGYEPGQSGGGCAGDHADVDHALSVPLTDIDQLACGRSWVCAHRRTDGAVLCWGDSELGELVPGDSSVCDRDPRVIDLATFASGHGQLVTSFQLVCALDTEASALRCWGGDEGTVTPADPPIVDPAIRMLPALTTVGDPIIATGAHPRMVALHDGLPNPDESYGGGCYVESSDGSVWCWGTNTLGQAGAPLGPALQMARTVSGAPLGVMDLAHSNGATCVLDAMGGLWCWGIDEHGDLAHPLGDAMPCTADTATYACTGTPLHYTGMPFSAIGTHASSTALCGISAGGGGTSGDVYCWGSGEFATNTRTDGSFVDEPLSAHVLRIDGTPLARVRSLAAGWSNMCAIDADGALWCWGANDHHQLQQASTTSTLGRAVRMTVP